MRKPLVVLVALGVLGLAACRHGDDTSKTVIMHAKIDSVRPLAEGDVRITASDNGIDLALIGDTISTGLSQEALAKAKKGTDTAAVKGDGFSASIEKMVKSTVQSSLGTRVGFPISEIKGARYTDGKIEFDWVNARRTMFDHTKVNNKPLLESFAPADAQRFVDAVNARKSASAIK